LSSRLLGLNDNFSRLGAGHFGN